MAGVGSARLTVNDNVRSGAANDDARPLRRCMQDDPDGSHGTQAGPSRTSGSSSDPRLLRSTPNNGGAGANPPLCHPRPHPQRVRKSALSGGEHVTRSAFPLLLRGKSRAGGMQEPTSRSRLHRAHLRLLPERARRMSCALQDTMREHRGPHPGLPTRSGGLLRGPLTRAPPDEGVGGRDGRSGTDDVSSCTGTQKAERPLHRRPQTQTGPPIPPATEPAQSAGDTPARTDAGPCNRRGRTAGTLARGPTIPHIR